MTIGPYEVEGVLRTGLFGAIQADFFEVDAPAPAASDIPSEALGLQQLPVANLADCCAQQTELFFQQQEHDPRYGFELFRRAIVERNQHAWEVIYTQYYVLVTGWVRRHPAFDSTGEEVQYFANSAFEKMWSSLTPERFERFSDLARLLRYLQMCVHSVIIDHVRETERARLEFSAERLSAEIGESGPSIEDQALDEVQGQEFWNRLNVCLRDEKERWVVYGSFIEALKPGELYKQHSTLFSSVGDVYRTKQNVLARLRRDPELRRFLSRHD